MSEQKEIRGHSCLRMLVCYILVIFMVKIGIMCYKARDRVIDYPDEDRNWRGRFLGYEAIRTRQIYHSGGIFHHPEQKYYAEIQVDPEKFAQALAGWKSDREAAFKRWDLNWNQPLKDAPEWFPEPTQENYVGDIRDSYSQVTIIKSPDSNRVFLIVD